MKELPLVRLSDLSHGDNSYIYVNREGLEVLRHMIDVALGDATGGTEVKSGVFANGNWSHLRLIMSSQDDFACGEKPCECGCQKEFLTAGTSP